MKRKKRIKWTTDMIKEEALKYNRRVDFKNNTPAYQAAIKLVILDEVCDHMKISFIKWNFNSIRKEALKYKYRLEFQKNSPSAYGAAIRRRIVDKVCSHMENQYNQWTKEKILNIAKKHNNRNEFHNDNPAAYSAAQRRGVVDEICVHMNSRFWSNEKIQKEALKYKIRMRFKTNSTAYKAAQRRGIIDKVCSHMKVIGGTSLFEKNLMSIIEKKYPKAQKLMDRNVKIQNKPHIKGFGLDIYIPELRKGIEFDGKYWHSVEGLKRSRSHWPKEDLKNYHNIKDNYFNNLGIEVLHIKEEDWITNSSKEIEKCFMFLNIGDLTNE